MTEENTKPKIALMTYAMDNRTAKGIAKYTRKLIEGLVEDKNFDFYLVHYDKVDDPLYKKGKEILMQSVRLPYGSRFISQMLFYWKYKDNPFDIVHWFHPRVYPFFWLVPAKKIIITVHGAGDITAPTNFIFSRSVFNFVLLHFHRFIDCIIVDSNFAKSEVIEHYKFPKEKVEVVYLGGGEIFKTLDKEKAKETLKKYGIEGDYILDVSRLQPHKNIITLIEAYSIMREENKNRREKLLIIGGSAYNQSDEYDAAKKSSFSKDIIFIDFVQSEDMNAIYSGADIFVFPSLNEGFGLPILEAMASGVPVITSNVTSMPEIGGDAVKTLDPNNKTALASAMDKLLEDKGLQTSMIEKGLIRARDFTWKKMVEETKKLYR